MLKPIQRDQSVGMIWPEDPAIDHSASEKTTVEGSEILKYVEDRVGDPGSWRRTVRFVDGEQPTVFVVGIIPGAERARIQDDCLSSEPKLRELAWRTFCASLRDIEPAGSLGADNAPRRSIDGVSYLDPAWVRRTFVGALHAAAVDVGLIAWSWNSLSEADAKK